MAAIFEFPAKRASNTEYVSIRWRHIISNKNLVHDYS